MTFSEQAKHKYVTGKSNAKSINTEDETSDDCSNSSDFDSLNKYQQLLTLYRATFLSEISRDYKLKLYLNKIKDHRSDILKNVYDLSNPDLSLKRKVKTLITSGEQESVKWAEKHSLDSPNILRNAIEIVAMDVYRTLPEGQRTVVKNRLNTSRADDASSDSVMALLKALADTSLELNEVHDLACSLLPNNSESLDLQPIEEAINQLSNKRKRISVARTTHKLIDDVLMLYSSFTFPKNSETVVSISQLVRSVSEVSEFQYDSLSKFFSSITKPENRRVDLDSIFATDRNIATIIHKRNRLLNAVLLFKNSDYAQMSGSISSLMKRFNDRVKAWLLDLIYYDQRANIYSVLGDAESLSRYLLSKLNAIADEADLNDLRIFTKNVEMVAKILNLSNEHPLMTTISEVYSQFLNSNEGEKEPDNVYQKVLDAFKAQAPPFEMPQHQIGDKFYEWNPSAFRLKAPRAFRFSDLPEKGTFESLKRIFLDFEGKLIAKGRATSDRLMNYVENEFDHSYGYVKDNLLKSPEIKSLLSIKRKDNEISHYSAYLASFISYISDLDSQICEGNFISNQMDVLLRFSLSVRGCDTGRMQAIALAYDQLPEKYKYPCLEKSEDSLTNKGLIFINEVSSNIMLQLVSNENDFMRRVTGFKSQPISELAHQALYIQNMIASKVGMQHKLAYDNNSHLISQKLFKMPLGKLLAVFYKYMSIDSCINRIRMEVRNNPDLYAPLSAILELEEGYRANEVWDMGDDFDQDPQLTEKGALKLLILSGRLIESR